MKKESFEIIKYIPFSYVGEWLLSSTNANVALVFMDFEYEGIIFDTTAQQIKDISLCMEYDADNNEYLINKYGLESYEDILSSAENYPEFFKILEKVGVIQKGQFVSSDDYSLEEALRELL